MPGLARPTQFFDNHSDDSLFARIAKDIEKKGYSINPGALSTELTSTLWHHQRNMTGNTYELAGIGRTQDYLQDKDIRGDKICWITGESLAGRQWLKWAAALQQYLNRRLFLGLFSFESHFAYYPPGTFYRKHLDAFCGEANRVLSVVVYLNKDWCDEDGGELILYHSDDDSLGIRVLPAWGTIVVFLSEEFPHEVLLAKRDRHSIAGWYRLNTSTIHRVDPSC